MLLLTFLRKRPTLSYQPLQTVQPLRLWTVWQNPQDRVQQAWTSSFREFLEFSTSSYFVPFLTCLNNLSFSNLIRHVLRTNFYQPTKVALSFRLAPDFLPEIEYPKKPFGFGMCLLAMIAWRGVLGEVLVLTIKSSSETPNSINLLNISTKWSWERMAILWDWGSRCETALYALFFFAFDIQCLIGVCALAGEFVLEGTDFRNGANLRFKADLFVPCGGWLVWLFLWIISWFGYFYFVYLF